LKQNHTQLPKNQYFISSEKDRVFILMSATFILKLPKAEIEKALKQVG
jgi:hypothetical protein